MKSIFGRHRIRANFYHFVSALYVLTMVLWGLDILTDFASTWIGFTLFVVDYIAQMYDPHPDNPGPWFKSHFHRFFNDDEEEVEMSFDISDYLPAFYLSLLIIMGGTIYIMIDTMISYTALLP